MKINIQIELEIDSTCHNWLPTAIQDNLESNEKINILNITQLNDNEESPLLIKWNKMGDHLQVLDYHTAYDLGFRYYSGPKYIPPERIASINNNYIGSGLILLDNIWTEVKPGSWLLFNNDKLISISNFS